MSSRAARASVGALVVLALFANVLLLDTRQPLPRASEYFWSQTPNDIFIWPHSNEYDQARAWWAGNHTVQILERPAARVESQSCRPSQHKGTLVFSLAPSYVARHLVTVGRNDSRALKIEIQEHFFEQTNDTRHNNDVCSLPYTDYHGGSNFYVVWRVYPLTGPDESEQTAPLSTVACSTEDHLNGRYTIWCRPPLYARFGLSAFTIYLDGMGFRFYRPEKPEQPWRWLLFTATWGPTMELAHEVCVTSNMIQEEKFLSRFGWTMSLFPRVPNPTTKPTRSGRHLPHHDDVYEYY